MPKYKTVRDDSYIAIVENSTNLLMAEVITQPSGHSVLHCTKWTHTLLNATYAFKTLLVTDYLSVHFSPLRVSYYERTIIIHRTKKIPTYTGLVIDLTRVVTEFDDVVRELYHSGYRITSSVNQDNYYNSTVSYKWISRGTDVVGHKHGHSKIHFIKNKCIICGQSPPAGIEVMIKLETLE